MARPKKLHPTEAELEVLHVLWEDGPSGVRHVMDALAAKKPRAYTSVMSLMSVMASKGLLRRSPQGRAFVYEANVARDKALGGMVGDLVERGFRGSASALVAQLLGRTSHKELEEIRKTIDAYKKQRGGP
jgi:BlaI family penicillinase repressor